MIKISHVMTIDTNKYSFLCIVYNFVLCVYFYWMKYVKYVLQAKSEMIELASNSLKKNEFDVKETRLKQI